MNMNLKDKVCNNISKPTGDSIAHLIAYECNVVVYPAWNYVFDDVCEETRRTIWNSVASPISFKLKEYGFTL